MKSWPSADTSVGSPNWLLDDSLMVCSQPSACLRDSLKEKRNLRETQNDFIQS